MKYVNESIHHRIDAKRNHAKHQVKDEKHTLHLYIIIFQYLYIVGECAHTHTDSYIQLVEPLDSQERKKNL